MIKNQILTTYTLASVLLSFNAFALENNDVKMAENLKRTGEYAKSQNIPLLLFFAAEDCGYCERLENDYLRALANIKRGQKQLIIRKIVIDSYDDFRDFSGKEIEASDFSDKFDIQVTPTLIFVNFEGDQISSPIIGYNGSYFFGAELDDSIVEATKIIRQNPLRLLKVSKTKN